MVGVENVNWETFVYELHPYRDPTRLDLIKDDSVFQQEFQREEASKSRGETSPYKPDVFKLTEPRVTSSSTKGERVVEEES